MSFAGTIQIPAQDLNTQSSTQLHALGTLGVGSDGRKYRYSLAGGSNLSAGQATVAAAKVANHTNQSLSSDSNTLVGSNTVRVAIGATAATQDQYKDGYLVVVDGTGAGTSHLIAGSSAAASSGVVEVRLAKPLSTALSTSDTKVSLVANPHSATIVHPGSAATYNFTGVPTIAVTAGNYFWSQTGGIGSVLSDGVIAKGTGATLTANAVAGALTTEAASSVTPRVAYAIEATVDTKYYPVFFTQD